MNTLFTYFICLFLFLGCSDQKSTRDSNSLDSWDQINAEAAKIPNIRSLIISKNNELLSETYFRPYSPDSLDHIRSVTKSVMGLLIGIALDKGIIHSIDQPISDYLAKKYPQYQSKMEKITIRHLLTMSGGFDWDESNVSEFNQWVASGDPMIYVLNRKLKHRPGEQFDYNSAGVHLLSAILTEASGMSTLNFANQHLFEPLEIKNIRWEKIGPYYNGGAGLQLRPIHMHNIGSMMINTGKFYSRQVVSKTWIDESMRWQISVGESTGYGYLWWIEKEVEEQNSAAIGFAGQFIVVLPESKVVMTATCNWQSLGGKAGIQQREIGQLMSKKIYPYLRTLIDISTDSTGP